MYDKYIQFLIIFSNRLCQRHRISMISELSLAAIQLLFLDISNTKTSVGDPILKLMLSEQKSV